MSKCFERPHWHSQGYNLFTIGSNDKQSKEPEKKSKKKYKAAVSLVINTESKKIIVTTQFYRSQGRFFSTRRINNLYINTNTLRPLFILMAVFTFNIVVFGRDYVGSIQNYI